MEAVACGVTVGEDEGFGIRDTECGDVEAKFGADGYQGYGMGGWTHAAFSVATQVGIGVCHLD